MTDFSDKMDDIPELEEDGEDDEPTNGNGSSGSAFLDAILERLTNATDTEEMREVLSELAPAVLTMQGKIAAVGSAKTLADIESGKTTGRTRNIATGIAIDKMANAGQLLQKLVPTRFDIISEIPFPVKKCPHCQEWIVKDEGDITGFSAPATSEAGDGELAGASGLGIPGAGDPSEPLDDPWGAAVGDA